MPLLFSRRRTIPAEAVLSRHERAGPGPSEFVCALFVPAIGDLGEDLDDRRLVPLHALEITVAFKFFNESVQENCLAVRKPPNQSGKRLNEASFRRMERLDASGDYL